MGSKVTGGKAISAAIRKGLAADGVRSIKVGVFPGALHPTGARVALVAAVTEFGRRGPDGNRVSPERPFLRQGAAQAREAVRNMIADQTDSQELVVDRALADRIGATVAVRVKGTIEELDVVDSGTLRDSITFKN